MSQDGEVIALDSNRAGTPEWWCDFWADCGHYHYYRQYMGMSHKEANEAIDRAGRARRKS